MASSRNSRPDPFSAADASSSDDESDLPRLPPGGRPFTPASPPPPPQGSPPPTPLLHRHPSHVRLPTPLPALPPRGPASADLFGPLVASVGVISDVQHAAGIPDGQSFHGVPRFYAAALEGARRAGDAFARDDGGAGVGVIIHLGDTVDGQHALRGNGTSEEALRSVVEALVGPREDRGEEESGAGDGAGDDDLAADNHANANGGAGGSSSSSGNGGSSSSSGNGGSSSSSGNGGSSSSSGNVGSGTKPRRQRRRRRPVLLNLTSNHDLYNFGGADRARLNALLGINPPAAAAAAEGDGKEQQQHAGASYYSFPLAPGWRALGLDAYDVSLLGRAPGDPRHARAAETLRARNPNGSDERPQGWDSPDGLKGVARRFVRFGGGASAEQIEWLRAELADARSLGERAIVLSHLPLHPATAPPSCLLWNYEEVVAALEEFPGTVAAVMAGHAHMNGYFFAPHGAGAAGWAEEGGGGADVGAGWGGGGVDGAAAARKGAAAAALGGGKGKGNGGGGIHHLVLPCVLETPPDRDCWAVLDVHERGLLLRGVDTCMSLAMGVGDAPGGGGGEATEATGAAAAAVAASEAADALARVAISAAS